MRTPVLAPIEFVESGCGPLPSASKDRCSDKGFLPFNVADYLMLLDWTRRQVREGKSGQIPGNLTPILVRLGVAAGNWLQLATGFERLFYRMAGSRESLTIQAARHHRRWYQAPGGQLLSASA